MAETVNRADFDGRPPVPASEYEYVSRRVNAGYELLFTFARCLLRALHQPDLDLLVVGAGGGAEIEYFLEGNPGWHMTGVDPSADMIELARAKAGNLAMADRVSLVRGTVQELPADTRFGAATCLNVLHFLSEDQVLALLKATRDHLRPGAPLIVATGGRGEDDGLTGLLMGAWQEYGVLMGLPPERMAGVIAEIKSRGEPTRHETYVRLLRSAGFEHVAPFFNGLNTIQGWVAA
jgi:tRNA (cmo5U34)-methyltransferase